MKKEPAVSRISAKQTVFQIIKFTFFSIGAGIIQAGSFTLLHEFARLPYWPAYLIGVVLSVLFNFTVNRRFTFKAANNIPVAMLKVAAYYVVFIPLSTWWGDALTQGAGWNEYLVLGGTMLVNLSTEYLFRPVCGIPRRNEYQPSGAEAAGESPGYPGREGEKPHMTVQQNEGKDTGRSPWVKLLWMAAIGCALVCLFLVSLRRAIPSAVYIVLLVLAFLCMLAAAVLTTMQEKPKRYGWRLAGYFGIFGVLVARVILAFVS